RILVFQHIRVEHPGIFRDFLVEDGIEWDAIELDENMPIPNLDSYDALWVMGGPMDVWEEEKYPWLTGEKAAIREAVVERNMPFLGVCLGHQLLADALGGKVAPMKEAEVGILDVSLTAAAVDDALFTGLPKTVKCLQWHGAEVTGLPPNTTVLACSPACGVQAFRVGKKAYGLQYHVELTASTVSDWGNIYVYRRSLERVLGAGSMPRLDAEAKLRMPTFNRDARLLYSNFISLVTRGV
ncbi:MAG: type 1 glutamine amidotransferase, partial [Acidiferrobacterales bacterium]|nr:type 1 glutamine amidotransferase [Acidiferrobacterales bacterium]